MKKTILSIVAVIGIVAGIAYVHYINKPAAAPDILTDAPIDADVPTGEPVVFELRYRGITGKKDDLHARGSYGFGSREEVDSAFFREVQQSTDHAVSPAHNPHLTDRQFAAVEHEDRRVLAFCFDLNGDGRFSEDERLKPTDISDHNRMYPDAKTFITPDFTITGDDGRPVPFRVIVWAQFRDNSDRVQVNWWPMGVYEGVAELNGKKMNCYLFPDFYKKSYTVFGASDYALVPASRKQSEYVPQRSLSSLIVQDKTFYRVTLRHDDDPQRLFVILAEDKSPRGKIAFKVHGGDNFNHRLNNANLRGPKDNRINFSITADMQELPVGEYVVSSGYLNYGTEKPEEPLEYSTSFSDVPVFAITAGETTTVQFGKPQAKLRAVELKRRYHSNEYKTKFPEGTPIYLDLTFTGMAGETYRGFQQRVQKENYTTQEYMKARMEIVDSADNPVLSEDMEYG